MREEGRGNEEWKMERSQRKKGRKEYLRARALHGWKGRGRMEKGL